MIYANTSAEKFAIEWIDRASASTGILQTSARGAVPLPDGKRMIFGSLGKANALMIADFDSEISLKNVQQISPNDANYGEPHGSVNGDIVFTKLFGAGRGSNTAQAGLYRLQTETFVDLTEQDGTAHCFWGSDGLSAYCNNAEKFHGIFRIPLANGIPGSGEVAIAFPKQAEVAIQDMDYSECRTVSYAYGTFCDDDHAIVTMQCENTDESGASTLSVSKLVLLDISVSPPTVTLLGKNLAEAFAGVGESSYTASCMIN